MGMQVGNTGFLNIMYQSSFFSSLTVFRLTHIRTLTVNSGTIYYLRLLSHAVYNCEVVAPWIKGLTCNVNVES